MIWNKEFNSFLLQLFAFNGQHEQLYSLLEQEELPVKELADYLEHYAFADYCINALADVQSPETGNLICHLYIEALNHGYTQVKWHTENNLKYLGHRNLQLILPYLQHPSAKIRSKFCEILQHIGNPDAIPAVLDLLDDEAEEVQYAAMDALERLVWKSPRNGSLPPNRKQVAASLLEHMRNDRNYRTLTAQALYETGDAEAIMAAFRDKDRDVRLAMADGHDYLYNKKTIPGFLDALSDSEHRVRQIALKNLGRIAEKDIIPSLLELQEDSSEDVRMALIIALVNIAEDEALPYLFPFINDPSARVRRNLIQISSRLNCSGTLSIAQAMLHDSNLQVQLDAQMMIKWLQTQ